MRRWRSPCKNAITLATKGSIVRDLAAPVNNAESYLRAELHVLSDNHLGRWS